jgi:hypothetical protein
MRVFFFFLMKQNSLQEHVAFGKRITFNPNFTIVLWRVQHKLYYFYKCWNFPPKKGFLLNNFFHKENEESFDAIQEYSVLRNGIFNFWLFNYIIN